MSKRKESRHSTITEAPAFETRDLSVRAVAWSGVGLVAALAVILVITVIFDAAHIGRLPTLLPPDGGLANNPVPPVPTAAARRVNPVGELQRVREEEDALLHSYTWVDQAKGVVRLPIERAKELLLQRGLPTRPESEAQPFQDKGTELPSSYSSGRSTERVR